MNMLKFGGMLRTFYILSQLMLVLAIALYFLVTIPSAYAVITNGGEAIDLIGQYEDETYTTPSYSINTANNGEAEVNQMGFSGPGDTLVDHVNNRLFVADSDNNRVLVHQLDENNQLIDYVPDWVIGQLDFETNTEHNNQFGLRTPVALAFDPVEEWLVVVEAFHRIKIYDLSEGITNGMNASWFLGTTSWVAGGSAGDGAHQLRTPRGAAFDSVNRRLFVAEQNPNRVKVFDISEGITNGMSASYLLGQTEHINGSPRNAQNGLNQPRGLAFDPVNERLFVAEHGGNRVKVFDLSEGISTGMDATFVLGQNNFIGSVGGSGRSRFSGIFGLDFDVINQRLFVAEAGPNRVKVFNLINGIETGMAASFILGQSSWTGTTASNTQSGLNHPRGLAFDSISNQLFVAETNGNRVKVFDAGYADPEPYLSLSISNDTVFEGESITL